MSDSTKPPVPPRVVEATYFRKSVSLGPIEIIGSTKHGTTALLSVADDGILEVGDTLKTKSFILNSREFKIIRRHEKPMKLAGAWYEVSLVSAPPNARQK